MRILDENNLVVDNPDYSAGYVRPEKLLIAHHDAVNAVEEQWHYETVKEYPNGGKDLEKVVDVPGVEASHAWDEYEDILRYIRYTPDELEDIADGAYISKLRNQVDLLTNTVGTLTTQNQQLTEELAAAKLILGVE